MSVLDLKRIEVDPQRLRSGVWHQIQYEADGSLGGWPCAPDADVPRLLIVPFGMAYARAIEDEQRAVLDRLRERKVSDDEKREMSGRVLARTTFRGCANIVVDGQPLEWSEAKAVEMMTDLRWAIFRDFVEAMATNKAAAIKREEEQAKGN